MGFPYKADAVVREKKYAQPLLVRMNLTISVPDLKFRSVAVVPQDDTARDLRWIPADELIPYEAE